MKNNSNLKDRLKGVLSFLKKPTAKYSLGTLLVVGFVTGIIFWGGFNTAMEMTTNKTNAPQLCHIGIIDGKG